VCWWSWPDQVRSLERLLELQFSWVLPGHGRAYRAESVAAMHRELRRLLVELR
jgi:glyoxylase-like metal-dependent hydrolase (beta-lactamase superfamily II)